MHVHYIPIAEFVTILHTPSQHSLFPCTRLKQYQGDSLCLRFSRNSTALMSLTNLDKLWKIGTGRPGILQSMGSQRVRHGLATEQQCPSTLFLDQLLINDEDSLKKLPHSPALYIVSTGSHSSPTGLSPIIHLISNSLYHSELTRN